jgi:hypothetical protein
MSPLADDRCSAVLSEQVGANSSAPSDSPTLLNMYTTPPVAYEITSEPELFYVHLLFALKVLVVTPAQRAAACT